MLAGRWLRGRRTHGCRAADRGRGPGLTPSGDDVLVGILATLSSGVAGPSGNRAASRLADAVIPACLRAPRHHFGVIFLILFP